VSSSVGSLRLVCGLLAVSLRTHGDQHAVISRPGVVTRRRSARCRILVGHGGRAVE
jgi:hypothetical protein